MDEAGVVLAAVDGQAATEPCLRWAELLAERLGSRVRVVHVGSARPELTQQVRGRALHLEQLDGPVAGTLLDALADPAVRLAVLGTRGDNAGPRPGGSTALAVLRGAAKPVLLVPPDGGRARQARLERVVVALDGSQEVSRALRSVVEEVLPVGTDVLVVHVLDDARMPAFWDRPGRDARLWAGEFLARHCDQPGAHAILVAGEPGPAALDVCRAERGDAVLLAWRRDDATGHALTFKKVLSLADVPVLVVPVQDPPR